MAVQYTGHMISVCTAWQRYCTVIGWSYCDIIRTICNNFINNINSKCKIKLKNYNRSKPEILRLLWFTIVFRLVSIIFVEYDLFNTTTFIQNCINKNFRINLTKFYINFLRQEHQIYVLYVSFNVWDSQVSSYTHFYFSFTVPLIKTIYNFNLHFISGYHKLNVFWPVAPVSCILYPISCILYPISCILYTGQWFL